MRSANLALLNECRRRRRRRRLLFQILQLGKAFWHEVCNEMALLSQLCWIFFLPCAIALLFELSLAEEENGNVKWDGCNSAAKTQLLTHAHTFSHFQVRRFRQQILAYQHACIYSTTKYPPFQLATHFWLHPRQGSNNNNNKRLVIERQKQRQQQCNNPNFKAKESTSYGG